MGRYKIRSQEIEAIRADNPLEEIQAFLQGTGVFVKIKKYTKRLCLVDIGGAGEANLQFVNNDDYIVKGFCGDILLLSKDNFENLFCGEVAETEKEVERFFLLTDAQCSHLVKGREGDRSVVYATYLIKRDDANRAVYKVCNIESGELCYFYSEDLIMKRFNGALVRTKSQKEITYNEYVEFLKEADKNFATLESIQYNFELNGFPAKVDFFLDLTEEYVDTILEVVAPYGEFIFGLPREIGIPREIWVDMPPRNRNLAREVKRQKEN